MVSKPLDISHWVRNPNLLGQEEIALLNEALVESPWCSAYRMLLAKAYENEGSHLSARSLKMAATYAGDREQLFKLMYNQEVIQVDEITGNKVAATEREDEETSSIEEPANEELVLEKNPKGEKGHIPAANEKIDFDEVVSYDPLTELKDKEIEPVESSRVELPFDHVAYDPEKELEKLIADKEEAEEGEEKDFLFWLNNVKDEDVPEAPQDKSPDTMQTLLDQFLATKTHRPIIKRDFYKPETKAEESETDNMEVVSETLLELYVKQGYYAKAIEGYEKLSLLNPPKSAYFAARIKEIENLPQDK